MSEWDKIQGVDGWQNKLRELLVKAREVAQAKDLAPRLAVNELLMTFAEKSWPNTEEIKALDEIACQTASALMRQTVEERLEAISERTGAYQKLTKQFEAQAEANAARADSIRMSAITGFLDCATKTVESAKELQKSLTNAAGDKALARKIEDAIAAIEELRSSVGKRI